jgi:formylglycine-generating enzyme required for sulfatase activity
MLDPVGFWSYARLDDEQSEGQLSALRLIVGRALGLQHGGKVTLWQDVHAIPYGADWAAEIERTIGQTTFFIPIVTPRFLKSENCRDEFRSYRRRLLALGRDDLVFPVHYVDVENVRPEETVFGDDLTMLRRAQWIDFRPLFYGDVKSSDVRRWAGDFAGGILIAIGREALPPTIAARPLATGEAARDGGATEMAHPPRSKGNRGETLPVESFERQAPPPSAKPPPPLLASAPRPGRTSDLRWRWAPVAVVAIALVVWSVLLLGRRAVVNVAGSPVKSLPAISDRVIPSSSTPSQAAVQRSSPLPAAPLTPTPSTSVDPNAAAGDRVIGVLSAAGESALRPKDLFKECKDCPEMVVVPAGEFIMGGDPRGSAKEWPQHHVKIAKSFAVGKSPITIGEFKAFVSATNYDTRPTCTAWISQSNAWSTERSWRDPGFLQTDGHPVTCLSWEDAQTYLKWLSLRTGKTYRLLTEAEWEYSARAGSTSSYFWGANVGVGHANCDGCGSEWDNKRTSPVGSFPANAFGLNDMAGNVSQWVSDCAHSNYQTSDNEVPPSDGSAWTSENCDARIVRGGAWHDEPVFVRSAARLWYSANARFNTQGFRAARALPFN